MGEKSRKKKQRRNEHPTLFVYEGAIRDFPKGSMLELYSGVSADEWQEIIIGTIKYKIFLDCLKEIAFPLLHEIWTKDDEWYRLMLEHNISRMRQLDPIPFLHINQNDIKLKFEEKVRRNAVEVAEDIKRFRAQHNQQSDHSKTDVSEL